MKNGFLKSIKFCRIVLTTLVFQFCFLGLLQASTTVSIHEKPVGLRNSTFQKIVVSGQVTSADDGNVLPGVTVLEKGTTNGVVTDFDGKFIISVSDINSTLVFQSLGFIPQEVTVGNQAIVNITLSPDVQSLDEIVLIGYGSQKRREVTGALSTLDAAPLQDQPVGQIAQKLQGQISGVRISQTSGRPGEGMSIRIRGASSINAGNNPLYVVDGFPIVGDINDINPNEIESLSVLKGPSASALYGSRAANGVILVTTKSAKPGETVTKVDISTGIGSIPQRGRPQRLNAKQFLQFQKSVFEDKIAYGTWTEEVPDLYRNPQSWTGPDTDWFDVLLDNSFITNYNLSFLSGKDKFSSANISSYYKEDGTIKNSGYERYSLRSNNTYQVNDFVKVGVNIAPTLELTHGVNPDGQFNVIFAGLTAGSIFSPYETNPDGTVKTSFSGPGLFNETNWLLSLTDQTNDSELFRLLSNAYIEIDFLKSLRFRSAISGELQNNKNRTFNPSYTGDIWSAPPNVANGSYFNSNASSWLTENTLTFNKTFNKNHNLDVLAGYSAQKFHQERSQVNGTNYPDDINGWVNASATQTGYSDVTEWSLLSMYTRLNYNFKGKYLLSASLRQDGSSRFGKDNQWGTFPSVSGGWIASDEEFASNWSVVNYLKLRGSYGETGNFNIGNYTQYSAISPTNYVFGGALASGRSLTSLGNSELGWERSKGYDIGLDLSFFQNRLSFTFDYYDKTTSDMLYQIDIPYGSGFSNIQSNIGEFHFWGFEASANSINTTGDLLWKTNFNISFDRNEVMQLGLNNTPLGGIGEQGTYWKSEVGEPMGMFWGYVYDGIYMTQAEFDSQPKHVSSEVGTVRYKDLDGDGVITRDDRTFIGNPSPKFYYGMTNNFNYKNFDLSIVIAGAYGQDIINGIREWGENQDGVFNVVPGLLDRWRSIENPGAGIYPKSTGPGTNFARYANSRWVEDGSYLTVKNITLGYKLPWENSIIKNSRVYFGVQQALVWTNYEGMNPEVSTNGLNGLNEGVDQGSYPVPRTFSLGLNMSF